MIKRLKFRVTGKCPNCLTGKQTYELDRKSPECPYLGCYQYKKRKCAFYKPLNEPKNGFISRLLERLSVTPPPKN